MFVESNLSYETHITTKLLFLPSKYCFESVDITGGETVVIETVKCLTEALENEMRESCGLTAMVRVSDASGNAAPSPGESRPLF